MSAGNLLYTIPIELFGSLPVVKDPSDNPIKDSSGNPIIDLDYLAFIVLVTFNAMFNKQSTDNTHNTHNTHNTYTRINDNILLTNTYLNGLLNKFFTAPNVNFLGYYNKIQSKEKNNLYIFSHGGITLDLLNCAQNCNNTQISFVQSLLNIINKKKR